MTATYYLGDLCYVIENSVWDEVCSLTFPAGGQERVGRFYLRDGREFFIFGTAWGDGVYHDQFGNSYSVDSGSIGAIRVEDIRASACSEEEMKRLGCIHTFEAPLTPDDCSYQNGLIRFGHVEIDTDPSYEEDEDLDLDYEENDDEEDDEWL